MINRVNIVIIFLFVMRLFQSPIGYSQTVAPPDSDDRRALMATEMAIQLGRQFGDSLWPGYNLNKFPLIVYVPEKWALLINAPVSATGFVDYPEGWPALSSHVLYHPGKFDELAGQLAFYIQFDSLNVAAVGFTGQDLRQFFEYLVHENFHQFQYINFGDIQWEREELYPIEDATNTSLASLEIRLLKSAIQYVKQAQDDSARNAAAQFVAVRSQRWRRADPYVQRYEQGQEINEGTAKYVEMKAVSLVPQIRLNSALVSNSEIAAADFDTVDMADCVIDKLNRLVENLIVKPEDMPRNRIYPVGAAQGFLLDHWGIDWKPPAQQAGSTFTFSGLLGDYLEADSSNIDSLVNVAKRRYDFDALLGVSHKLITEYREGFSADSAAFESQPGLRVEFRLDGKNLRRSRNSGAKKWLVDNGSMELRKHFNIYVLQSVSGQNLYFRLQEAGLLELNDWPTRAKTIIFYCPELASCIIDEKPKKRVDTLDCRFNKLQLTGADFEIDTDRAGRIAVANNHVLIDLLD